MDKVLAAQRDCRKTLCLKKFHKNLPQQAQKSPKCCSEHKKQGAFQLFSPTFKRSVFEKGLFRQFQRLALLAGGRAWALLGSRKNLKPACPGRQAREKYLKMRQTPTCPVHAVLGGSSLPCSITEENHATAKAALLQKLELQSNVGREALFATSHYNRCEEQMTLVDQPCSKGVGSKLRTTYEDILFDCFFQLSNGFRIEVSLNLCLASGYGLQCPGVHKFVSSLPDLCEVAHEWRLSG